MADRLPAEILQRILVGLLTKYTSSEGGISYSTVHLKVASLVCKAWCGPAQRLLCSCWSIDCLDGFSQHLRSLDSETLPPCISLSVAPTKHHSRGIPPCPAGQPRRHSETYFKDLRELFVSLSWRRYHLNEHGSETYELFRVVKKANKLRTLTVIKQNAIPGRDYWNEHTGDPVIKLEELPRFLADCLADKKQLKHLFVSWIALSTTFFDAPRTPLPPITFRLSQLMLMACVISDSEFKWLLSSQVGSLKNLCLSRIAGVSKSVFTSAVIKVAPYLTRLSLNLLPFSWPEDIPLDEGEYHAKDLRLPLTFKHRDRPFPRPSLMGSSNEILKHSPNLQHLQLRDPLFAVDQAFNDGLAELLSFTYFRSPLGGRESMGRLERGIRDMRFFPKLKVFTLHWDSTAHLLTNQYCEAYKRWFGDVPFEVHVKMSQGQFSYMWDQGSGYFEEVDSDEEVSKMWNV